MELEDQLEWPQLTFCVLGLPHLDGTAPGHGGLHCFLLVSVSMRPEHFFVCEFCIHHCLCWNTGASHASHLGGPMAYGSRVSYIKKRQVWKSPSETDWPHLRIMPGFSTAKNRSILMLTSTCWQEISLSNAVELTTVTPQKQKICRFKRRFLPVFENSRGSIVCLRAANPVMRLDWAVLFLRTSADCHTETGTYIKTKLPNHGTSRDLLRVGRQWNLWNFRKPAKDDV